MLKGEILLEYTNLISPNEYKKNDKIIFYIESKSVNMYCNVCNKYRKFKKTKITYIFKKTLNLSIVYSKYGYEYEKIFKEEEPIEVLRILGLINNIEEYQKIYNHV